jgi:hypothetical protein
VRRSSCPRTPSRPLQGKARWRTVRYLAAAWLLSILERQGKVAGAHLPLPSGPTGPPPFHELMASASASFAAQPEPPSSPCSSFSYMATALPRLARAEESQQRIPGGRGPPAGCRLRSYKRCLLTLLPCTRVLLYF